MLWFNALGIFSLSFGLLFVFSKETLALISLIVERPFHGLKGQAPKNRFSKFFLRIVVATDEIIIGGSKSVGILLIVLSAFFFYTAFWVL